MRISDLNFHTEFTVAPYYNYCIFNEYSGLYESNMDYDRFNLVETTFENSIYVGTRLNPYLILFRAFPNKDNNVVFHKNTKTISKNAFNKYRSIYQPNNAEKLNEIILNEELCCSLVELYNVNAKGVVSYSTNTRVLAGYDIPDICAHMSYVYFPNIKVSSFKCKESKFFYVNGYMEKEYTGKETKIDSPTLAYLERSIPYFYTYFDRMPKVFDYIISKNLFKYEEINDILSIYSDNGPIKNRLLKYREDNYAIEYQFEQDNPISYKDLEDCIEFEDNKVDAVSKKLDYEIITRDVCDAPLVDPGEMSRVKLLAFANQKVNPRDIYMCQYNGDTAFIEISNYGHDGYYKVMGKYIDTMDLFLTRAQASFREKYADKITKLCGTNPKAIYKLMYSNNTIQYGTGVYITPQYGLFEKSIIDGKLVTVKKLDYDNPNFDEKSLELFEPYFCLRKKTDNGFEYAVFRKVTDFKHIFDYMDRIGTNLVHNARKFDNMGFAPYRVIKGVNKNIVNSGNKEYKLAEIIGYIASILNATLNNSVEGVVSSYKHDNKYQGFSSTEIQEILSKYFPFRTYGSRLYYYGYDKYFVDGDDMYLYNENWFKLFYDTVKKHPTTVYSSCSDINPRKNLDIFKNYTIKDKFLNCFIKAVDIASSFDRFITLIKDLLVNRGDTLVDTQHIEVEVEERR